MSRPPRAPDGCLSAHPSAGSRHAPLAPFQGLLRLAGRYRGRERLGDGSAVTGELSLLPIVGAAALLLRYALVTDDGVRLREELALVGPSEQGRLVFWNLDDARRTLDAYELSTSGASDGQRVFEFRTAASAQTGRRIRLVLESDGAVVYAGEREAEAGPGGEPALRLLRVD